MVTRTAVLDYLISDCRDYLITASSRKWGQDWHLEAEVVVYLNENAGVFAMLSQGEKDRFWEELAKPAEEPKGYQRITR